MYPTNPRAVANIIAPQIASIHSTALSHRPITSCLPTTHARPCPQATPNGLSSRRFLMPSHKHLLSTLQQSSIQYFVDRAHDNHFSNSVLDLLPPPHNHNQASAGLRAHPNRMRDISPPFGAARHKIRRRMSMNVPRLCSRRSTLPHPTSGPNPPHWTRARHRAISPGCSPASPPLGPPQATSVFKPPTRPNIGRLDA